MATRAVVDVNNPESASQTWEKIWDARSVLISSNTHWSEQLPSSNLFSTEKYKDTLVKNDVEKNYVNQLFFSSKNIQNLDARLRFAVFKMSNGEYHLAPQNRQELVIIMRAIYTNYGQNREDNIVKQVEELNKLIINKISPELYSRATQYLKYLKDANEGHRILVARPVNVNNTGLKVLNMGSAIGL